MVVHLIAQVCWYALPWIRAMAWAEGIRLTPLDIHLPARQPNTDCPNWEKDFLVMFWARVPLVEIGWPYQFMWANDNNQERPHELFPSPLSSPTVSIPPDETRRSWNLTTSELYAGKNRSGYKCQELRARSSGPLFAAWGIPIMSFPIDSRADFQADRTLECISISLLIGMLMLSSISINCRCSQFFLSHSLSLTRIVHLHPILSSVIEIIQLVWQQQGWFSGSLYQHRNSFGYPFFFLWQTQTRSKLLAVQSKH